MERHTGHGPDSTVEEPAGQRLAQGILAPLLPTRYEVETLVDLGEEIRDLDRVVLDITVHRDDHVTPSHGEPVRQSLRLTEVAPVPDPANSIIHGS